MPLADRKAVVMNQPGPTELDGLRAQLSIPRVVAQSLGGRCWFPDLLQFSTGELMLNHSLNADSNGNDANAQAVMISNDGGKRFDFAYDVSGFHNGGGEVRLSLPDGRIVGVSTFLRPDPPTQSRRFVAHRWTYDRGGKRYMVEPWGATVEGLPRDPEPLGTTSRTWWSRVNWFGDVVPIGTRRWVTTLSLRHAGDLLETTVALESEDEGRNWQYLSTIAAADSIPDAAEGFDEPCLIQLEDGDLMCVSRVGCGEEQKLARTYSADGGRSWSSIDRLPAYSVAPQILRLTNGLLVLSTGRPGLSVWVSADPRGVGWQALDIMNHHNARCGPGQRIQVDAGAPITDHQTTAYTAMVEAAPNRVLLVYDRIPYGWNPAPTGATDKNQIYLLEMSLERR